MKEFFTGAFVVALIMVISGFTSHPVMIGWTVFTGIGSLVCWLIVIFKSSNN